MKKLITSSSTLWSCFIALAMMAVSQGVRAEYVPLTALDGVNSWNSSSEYYDKLVDQKIDTKWGGWFDPSLSDEDSYPANDENSYNHMYIIVKAEKGVVPEYYFLVTGNDTGSNPGRNWASWKIYGGNFASDELAVRNGEGWTLLDSKEDEPLPASNFGIANLEFDYTGGESFQYFWIELEKTVEGADVYQQMSEWGLGTYGEFEKYLKWKADQPTGTDQPVKYTHLASSGGYDGETPPNLLDGDTGTKWCCGFTGRNKGETSNGAWVIFKASRGMAPAYYILATANDTQSYPDRNWKQWQIYGMNATSDEDVTRDSEGWVLLDDKTNVPTGTGMNELPAANYTSSFFTLSETNTTEYRYFKVELDQIKGGGTMQMSELALGDAYTVILDRDELAESAGANYNPDLFAEKALLDQFAALIDQVKACTDPVQLGELRSSVDEMTAAVNASAASYAELLTARNQALNAIEGGELSEAAVAYLTAWVSETDAVAPGEDYPVGNIAYIKANRQITGDEALKEANRINTYIINNSAIPDPINADGDPGFYTHINGSGGFGGEDDAMLYDGNAKGDGQTKWCTNGVSADKPAWTVFKTLEPIQPTYYGLVTGNDTYTYTGRNWRDWKIWGANFDEEEVDPESIRGSNKWVLIDEKKNVGEDVLHIENEFESYIYLSEGCKVPYQYFKIEVTAAVSGDLIQMNEFTFYNTGNLVQYRQDFVDDFADFDPDERPAYQGYIDDYKEKYQELATTVNAPDVMKLKNELQAMRDRIETSADLYEEYEAIYADIEGLDTESESLNAWKEGYTKENVAPCAKYIRGTHAYITENLSLDNDDMQAEINYLNNIVNAVYEDLYILLGGHTMGEWGDGFYGHLIDGIDKDSEEKNDDGSPVQPGTKWGGNADLDGNTYIIFRTLDKSNPFFYTLTTGNDTKTHTGRNWGTWYIYGANFEGDGGATKDAEGWVLIDSKENIGQDRLHPENETPSYFGFSTETTEEYIYYKVVVTRAYSGSQVQMNEMHFGTEEEFEEIKKEYTEAAQDFDFNVIAEQALIDKYEATIPQIDECANMEALFRVNYQLETLRDSISASEALYAKYDAQVEANKAYIEENKLGESEALTIFVNYLTLPADQEPSELYPNGPAAYVLDEHVLPDSVLTDEMEFMEALKAAAVAAGYGPGMDISSLIVNRTFAKAGETLKNEKNENIGREAEGWDGYIYRTNNDGESDIYAAEFCNENKTFDISQTLTGMKNGYYKVTLNAGYRANGDEKMLSYNYAPLAYANEIATYVPVLREGAAETEEDAWTGSYADKQIYSADSTETYGWGIWGCEGAAHAFAQGRYAITLVTKVTDGTLTFGVKNEGTKGNEWTAVGNFGLVYLGEIGEAGTAIALEEAANYNTDRINTLIELYESFVDDLEDYSDAPNFGAAQKQTLAENSGLATYEAEQIISETMKAIYDTKKAYLALKDASDKVWNKWSDFSNEPFDEAVYEVRAGLDEGAYDDAAAAQEAKVKLYADWPDYLEMTGNGKVGDLVQEEFGFDIVTTGGRPYLDLAKLYEPLTEDEVILAFEYTADQDIENGLFMYNTPQLMTDVRDVIPTLPAVEDWTKVYYNVSNGIKALQFGSAVDHGIRWYINYGLTANDDPLSLVARNFRIITKAQMKAEGGKPLNGEDGDLNGDGKIDIADAVTVLNIMAAGEYNAEADVNGDQKVDIADFVTILNMMAAQ
ncbi:MAG: dockerin type I repeat-containing protein [Bacteroidaceae bacterium]|nr:dockerin type I repeat-containing protein [Bacteroidaceae bacterium]